MLLITKTSMRKYHYTALVKGNKIESTSTAELSKAINEAIGFPIVSQNVLYNYFLRPQIMKNNKLATLNLERSLVTPSS